MVAHSKLLYLWDFFEFIKTYIELRKEYKFNRVKDMSI